LTGGVQEYFLPQGAGYSSYATAYRKDISRGSLLPQYMAIKLYALCNLYALSFTVSQILIVKNLNYSKV